MVHSLHQHDAPGFDPTAERLLEPIGLGGQLCDIKAGRDTIKRAAEALRQAMLHVMQNETAKDSDGRALFSYAHPMFWAPFSLVGDGN